MSEQKSKVEIYTWDHCPYCQRALALLNSKSIQYVQHKIDGDEDARSKMIARTGGPKSVPQIFIDDVHYGGCDDLHALESQGKLDELIKN